MIDEHFSRQWVAGHQAFSADLARLADSLGQRASSALRKLRGIGVAYAHPAAHGFAAVVSTFVLFVTVGMLAFPAPLLAAQPPVEIAAPQCRPPAMLA